MLYAFHLRIVISKYHILKSGNRLQVKVDKLLDGTHVQKYLNVIFQFDEGER